MLQSFVNWFTNDLEMIVTQVVAFDSSIRFDALYVVTYHKVVQSYSVNAIILLHYNNLVCKYIVNCYCLMF